MSHRRHRGVTVSGYQLFKHPAGVRLENSPPIISRAGWQRANQTQETTWIPEVRRLARDLSTLGPAVVPFSAIPDHSFARFTEVRLLSA
jgi:hypothetical protein